jgi:hypothetical protein
MAQRERSIFSSTIFSAGAAPGESRAARACPALWTFAFVLALGAAAACGGGDDDGTTGDGDGDNSDTDAGVIGDPNCQTPDMVGLTDSCDEEPCLAPPEYGFQIRDVGTTIHSGEDIEYCEVVQMPGDESDTYYINGFDSAMTTGSHHLIVAAIEPGSATDANATVGDRVECFGPASGFGGDLLDVTGQQLPYHAEAFPDGVGRVYHGGQKLVFNYHYLNATDGDLQARGAVNFYTADASCVEKIAESAGFFFFGIDVDNGDTASYTSTCSFSQDVMVSKLTRHTHQWGTDFPVKYAGGANDGDLIYTSPSYEDPDYTFDEPVLFKAGEGFTWTCNYDNDSGHHLGFGENTTDEMCILFATIYSPDGREVSGEEGCIR